MAKDTSKKDNAYKIKLLRLWDILCQETDEDHPISTQQLIARLAEEGIQCDRKVLARDIALLTESNYDIIRHDKRIGHSNAYYVGERHFQDPELRILIDAVRAASFISPIKTDRLVEKIAKLGGRHRAEQLMNGSTRFANLKHSNEDILYLVNTLEQAIIEKKQVRFRHFKLGRNRERIFSNNGDFYIVNPITMLYKDDNYYLVCWDVEKNGPRHFRIDRIVNRDAEKLETDAVLGMTPEEFMETTSGLFKMFSGRHADIQLAFTESLIPVMYDQFGENLAITELEPGIFTATVHVQISDTFWGWIFQFIGKMKILSPAFAVKEYRKQARAALKKDPLDPDSEYITEWDEDF